jgi:hypothetical protein
MQEILLAVPEGRESVRQRQRAESHPVEWLLVTTLPIDTPEQVRTVVAYYCVRWSI